jgi:hypothetical protein
MTKRSTNMSLLKKVGNKTIFEFSCISAEIDVAEQKNSLAARRCSLDVTELQYHIVFATATDTALGEPERQMGPFFSI